MKKTKISIIIPIYNSSKYLRKCLNSVINQSIKDIEIICVDSNSIDNSFNILKEYKNKDKRIKIYHLNTTPASISRNYGIKQAKGEYIAFLDSDDYLNSKALEIAYIEAKRQDADICYWEYKYLYENERKLSKNKLGNNDNKNGLLIDNKNNKFQLTNPGVCNKLYKNSFLKKNSINFIEIYKSEDIYFTYLAFSEAKKIVAIDKALYFYRLRNNSITKKVYYHPYDFCISLIELKKQLIKRKIYKDYYLTYANLVISIFNFEFNNNNNLMNVNDRKEFFKNFKNKYYKKIIDKKIECIVKQNFSIQKYLYNKTIKNKEPKISIIVPIHNTQKYIFECLESIKNQTFKNIEVLCIDSSTDNTKETVLKFCKDDPRFLYIYDENSSYGYKINKGIDISKGKYIGIVDSDDYVDKGAYSYYYKNIVSNHCDVLKSNAKQVTNYHNSLRQRILGVSYDNNVYCKTLFPKKNPSIIYKDLGHIWSGLYLKDFLVKNKIKLNESPGASYQDTGLCVLSVLLAKRIIYIDKTFYNYRIGRKDNSVNDKTKCLCILDEYNYIKHFLSKNKIELTKKQKDAIDVKFMHVFNWNFYRLKKEDDLIFFNKIQKFNNSLNKNYYINKLNSFEKHRYNELVYGKELIKNKLSIIIPTSKTDKNLFNCLNSILGQKYKNIEIIIINKEKNNEKIERFIKGTENIKVLNINEKNSPEIWNVGINECIGDYIMFLKKPTALKDDVINGLLYTAIKNKISYIFCDTNYKFELNGKKYKYRTTKDNKLFIELKSNIKQNEFLLLIDNNKKTIKDFKSIINKLI